MQNLELISKFVRESGLRKISVALFFFSVLAFLVFMSKIDEKTFAELVFWIIAAVFGGNSFEHLVKAKAPKNETPPNKTPS